MTAPATLRCACGTVQLRTAGTPILTAECFCSSCRAAAARLGRLSGAGNIASAAGGTPFVLYRKDRVLILAGASRLRAFRLSDRATTRRAVATCCNTPMFLEFRGGHWLSLYAGIFPPDRRPPIGLRTMLADLPPGTVLPPGPPGARRQGARALLALAAAWAAMGFRTPQLQIEEGQFDV